MLLFCLPVQPSMAHSARKDSPELPDFSMLKRLAKDQLIYLLEQVKSRYVAALFGSADFRLPPTVDIPPRKYLSVLLIQLVDE